MRPWEAAQVVKKCMVLKNPKVHCHVYKRLQYVPTCHISPRSNCIYSRSGNTSFVLWPHFVCISHSCAAICTSHRLYIALKKCIHTYIHTIHSESGGKKLLVQDLTWLVVSFSLQKYRYMTDDVALGHICLLVLQFSPYQSFCHCSISVYIYLLSTLFFFCWRYSPLWALACRTIPLHFSLSFTNSLHLLTPSTWRSLSTSYLTLYTLLQEVEDSLQLPKFIPSPFLSIIKSIQLTPLINFCNNKFFYCVGFLTPCQTPNLEDQGIPFCLGHHPWPIWHGRPYQLHTLLPA